MNLPLIKKFFCFEKKDIGFISICDIKLFLTCLGYDADALLAVATSTSASSIAAKMVSNSKYEFLF